jgi:hypothetical protein
VALAHKPAAGSSHELTRGLISQEALECCAHGSGVPGRHERSVLTVPHNVDLSVRLRDDYRFGHRQGFRDHRHAGVLVDIFERDDNDA